MTSHKFADNTTTTNSQITKNNWSNSSNRKNFYDKIPIDLLVNYASLGGLSTGEDISLIWNKIKNSSSILEVGAGFGRVINLLIEKGFKGKITALESSNNFCNYLHHRFPTEIETINESALDCFFEKKFDNILWLWSGISDFPKKEQLTTLKNITSFLNPNGYLFLETFPSNEIPKNASTTTTQDYTIISEGSIAHGYIPSPSEVKEYANQLGLSFEKFSYQTSTNRKRTLYFLKKLP